MKKISLNRNKIAIIRLEGTIGSMGVKSGSINFASMYSYIKKAFEVRNCKAIVLIINSPGGSAAQSELISNFIIANAKKKEIPVLAFAEDFAASGGFMLLCAANESYAMKSSLVGSIGVISASFGFDKTIEKLGITRRVYHKGERKSILDPFRPIEEEDIEIIDDIQNDIYSFFKEYVKRQRGDRLLDDNLKEIFSGRIWAGDKAFNLGLVDGIVDNYMIYLKERFGDDVKFVMINKTRTSFIKKIGLLGSIIESIM